jgi:hypothetical protein
VKKIFYIILSLQLLSGNQLLSELAKVPVLIEHYKEHCMENRTMDFFTFLKLHYANPEHQKSDAKHDSLPLKSSLSAHGETMVLIPPFTPSVCDIVLENIDYQSLILKENPFFDSKMSFSVFHPPRV